MFEENDDVENNQNDEDYSDNEEISDLNLEDDEMTKEDNTFKLVTYKNILDDMQKKKLKQHFHILQNLKKRVLWVLDYNNLQMVQNHELMSLD